MAATGWSTSIVSAEAGLTHRIAMACELYTEQHDGGMPHSWDDLASSDFEPWDETYKEIRPTKRYAFLRQSVLLEDGREIVIIARRPFRDLAYSSDVGRRVIVHIPGRKQFSSHWMKEDEIQRVFHEAKSSLPEPDQELGRMYPIAGLFRPLFGDLAIGMTPYMLSAWGLLISAGMVALLVVSWRLFSPRRDSVIPAARQ